MSFQKTIIILFGLLILGLILTGCSTQTTPALDCSACPTKTELKEKIVEREVEVIKYICADGKEVNDKTNCINYIDTTWDLSANKLDLINKLNAITDFLGLQKAVDVTKLVINDDTIEISYTQINAEFQKNGVGQTMYSVLKETAEYLKKNKRLEFNIKITALTSNGGFVFSKTTSKDDLFKILNYELSEDEWINSII